MFSALYRYWLKNKVHYSRLYILCSACSLYMFCMFLLHALHVPPACSTCSFYMFSMFKGHVLHVPFACSVCHFTYTLRTSVSHNSLKSSPIYTIFIYLSSLYWDLDVHTACEEILWTFLSSSFWQCEAVEHSVLGGSGRPPLTTGRPWPDPVVRSVWGRVTVGQW